MPIYNISFWNLENLFDIQNSPRRTEKLQRAIGSDLNGWTQTKLNGKISQLASIISQMSNGNGPDMLGVCEVENSHVLDLLTQALNPLNRNYSVVHKDTVDKRGIDVAFIYDADLFTVEKDDSGNDLIFDHVVMRRTATRAILQVNFLTEHSGNSKRLVLLGNHWPSRSGGQYESEGYRHIAGETLSYFHQRIREVHGDDTPVLAMGDFNDEPFNESITRFALAVRSRAKVVNAISKPYFQNMMWPLMDQGVGTLFYNNFPNMLDQFLANENMLKQNSSLRAIPNSVEINNFSEMVDTGHYPRPIRYGLGQNTNQNGFSDHFPISISIEE